MIRFESGASSRQVFTDDRHDSPGWRNLEVETDRFAAELQRLAYGEQKLVPLLGWPCETMNGTWRFRLSFKNHIGSVLSSHLQL